MILINNQIIKMVSIAISCVIISACDVEFKNPVGSEESTSGTADFSNFVAIGDSLTAGYADSALYLHGQENSYPSVLAAQFAQAGGGGFNQPWVSDNLGGLLFGGTPNPSFGNRLVLDAETESPEPIAGTPTTEVIGSGLNGTAFNNMGVPGAKSFHAGAAGYGYDGGGAGFPATSNPYFVRFAISGATSSMIGDAIAQQPSFYVMWIGNNDVLSYATSGGTGVDRTGDFNAAGYGPDDITDPTVVFPTTYGQLVGAFTAANPDVKGVLVNIPDVGTIPFFTTVPYNPVPLDQASADALNAAYAPYNAGVAAILGGADPDQVALRTINFTAGQNAVVILDEDLTDLTGVNPPATSGLINMRQATADDLLLLTTSSIIGELVNPADDPLDPASPRWGVSAPLQDGDVLIPSEILAIDTARLAFNATIEGAASADANLLFFDAAAVMETLNDTGIDYGTGFVDATYATGGAFSLDGVHPTARGYAVIANNIIEIINEGFGATVQSVDPGAKSTIFFK